MIDGTRERIDDLANEVREVMIAIRELKESLPETPRRRRSRP
jgi:hypothetical protein